MQNQTMQFVRGLVLIPFLATGSPLAILDNVKTPAEDLGKGGYVALPVFPPEVSLEDSLLEARVDKARKIDAYYAKRGMPLFGYGAKMVAEAEKNNLDWRLLPAIAIKESTGGKFACVGNPFGWGSCSIEFDTWNEAIETVAFNLGGNNPNTARYYKDKTIEEKLYNYNTSVIPTYTTEIFKFMDLIEKGG